MGKFLKLLFGNRKYFLLFVLSIATTIVALILWFYFIVLVEKKPAQPSYDFLLSVLPTVHSPAWGWFYVLGYAFVLLIMLPITVIKQPEKLPYFIFILAFCTLIRDFLFSMTVLEAPAAMMNGAKLLPMIEFGRDLFPSGHAGLPFVVGLMTDVKWFKYFAFGMSIALAITVLLMRFHYSIDVFAGYLVFYGLYMFINKYIGPWFKIEHASAK